MTPKPFKVGIVGAGSVARQFHLPGWKAIPGVTIAAIADIDKAAAEGKAREYGIPNVFTDFRDLVDLDLDAVDVCTPNMVHRPVVMAALDAGKHVLCEKPLAVTSKEVREMGESADEKGLKLMTGQHYRFGPQAGAIHDWAREGGLGEVYHARVRAMRRATLPTQAGFIDKTLSGGGPCMDIGIHALDLCLWFMGFPDPQRVSGTAKVNFAKGHRIPGAWGEWDRRLFSVEDFAAGFVHFRNGATLTLETAWLGHQELVEDLSCRIFGLEAGVAWPSGEIVTFESGTFRHRSLPIPMSVENPHTGALRAFHDCVANNKPSPVPWQESLKSIAILEGIYESQARQREVEINLDL